MKNLIAELLVKLAQKEEESKELVAQVEALEIVVTALLRQMATSDQQALIDSIEGRWIRQARYPGSARGCRVAAAIRKEAVEASAQLSRY